jgi:hypothetical protein
MGAADARRPAAAPLGAGALLSDHEPLDPDQIFCQRWIDRNLTINLLAPRQ